MRTDLDSTAMEIGSLRKAKREIEKRIAAVEQKIEQSPKREQEMISLIRDYENQKRSYDDLQKKKLEADVSQNLEKRQKGTQFQILDPANLPEDPFRPDRKKVMAIALLLALAAGFGGSIFLEGMDQKLRGVRDFKHFFDVLVIGSIPVVEDRRVKREAAALRAGILLGLAGFAVAFSALLLVYHEKIRSIARF